MSTTSESILNRLSQLPIVTSAYSWSSHYYSKVKNSSSVANATLGTAEKTMMLTADKLKPVVQRLEKPISAVDAMACKTFIKLQEKFPAVNKTPEEVAASVKTAWNDARPVENLKQYGVLKVTAIKDYAVQKTEILTSSHYGQVIGTAVNAAFCKAEQSVDYYLPSDSDEQETKLCAEDATSDKMWKISSKVKGCIAARIHLTVKNYQESIPGQRLQSGLKMIETATAAVTGVLQSRLALVQTSAKPYWDEVNQKLDAMEKQVTGSTFSGYLKTAYSTSLQTFSFARQHAQTSLCKMQQTGTDFLNLLSKVIKRDDTMSVASMLVPVKSWFVAVEASS